MPVRTTLETPVDATVASERDEQLELDTVNSVVYVIQSSYNHNDQDNHRVSDQALVTAEGWFAESESAAARSEQLNARNHTYYEAAMAVKKRDRDAQIRAAEKKNLEAAAIRSAGMQKSDVVVPPAFVPETFEKFFSGSNHTTYEPIAIRRSDHDGIARAVAI